MDKISVDLIHEIFIKLPVKLLLQARCVSKLWCKIIDDPVFAHMQYDYGEVEQNTLLLLRTSDSSRPVDTTSLFAAAGYYNEESRMIFAATVPMVKFQAKSFGDYGSCNGLLYFAEHNTGKIVVSNPLKSQFMILPLPPIRMSYRWDSYWTAIGLGFDSSTKTFKMVCIKKKTESSHFTLVHTLGTTSWREGPSIPAYHYRMFPLDYKSVFVHGFLHWMMDPSKKNCRGRILAFDVIKEIFKVIPHPAEISFKEHDRYYNGRYYRILDIKGDLGMLDLSGGTKFDMWIMDHEKISWSKVYTIDITIVGKIYVNITGVIGLWKHDEILFQFRHQDYSFRDFVKYWSYNLRTGNIKECDDQSCKAQVISLKGSLISISSATEVS